MNNTIKEYGRLYWHEFLTLSLFIVVVVLGIMLANKPEPEIKEVFGPSPIEYVTETVIITDEEYENEINDLENELLLAQRDIDELEAKPDSLVTAIKYFAAFYFIIGVVYGIYKFLDVLSDLGDSDINITKKIVVFELTLFLLSIVFWAFILYHEKQDE